jgi:hypothetical protein
VRLACVKHAASVRSEPGSNSQVHPRSKPTIPSEAKTPPETINPTRTNRPRHIGFPSPNPKVRERHPKRSVTHQKDTSPNTPNNQPMKPRTYPDPTSQSIIHPPLTQRTLRAPPTYPFLAYEQLERTNKPSHPGRRQGTGLTCFGMHHFRRRSSNISEPRGKSKTNRPQRRAGM